MILHVSRSNPKSTGTLQQPDITSEDSEKSTLVPIAKDQPQKAVEIEINSNDRDLSLFGKRIRKARQDSGKSIRAMAKELHISSSRLSQIENGCYPHPVSSTLKSKLLIHLKIPH